MTIASTLKSREAAKAAKDATSMPPPPPCKLSSNATSKSTIQPSGKIASTAPIASNSNTVAKTKLGTPSPLLASSVSVQPAAAAAVAKKTVSISVPSTTTKRTISAAVPQPVLSSTTAATKISTTTRVAPKYVVKNPATTASTTVTSSVINRQPIPAAPKQQVVVPSPVTSTYHYTTQQHHTTPETAVGYTKKKSGHPLRRGKWTSEEETYAARLIQEFKSGLLPLTDGTTLRNFLSKLLNCDPMRISKKFVGNNCIGKQVFRRRVADINRLNKEQICQLRVELGELERRFFDRVAQTNRVKAPGILGTLTTGIPTANPNIMRVEKVDTQPTPPWLQPPKTYKPKGKFAEKTALAKAAATAAARPPPTSRPTAATTQKVTVSSSTPLGDSKSNMEKAMEVITRSGSSLNRLTESTEDSSIPRSESALEQLARTASAAKFVEDIVNGEEDTEVPNKKLSKSSIQGSFEALMSMDIHSVENLVELAATSNSSAILSELNKTYSDAGKGTSSNNLSNRMESFIKSLSTANLLKSGLDSQQAIGSLLGSTSSFFDGDKISGRNESSTGFSQLRAADGLANGPHDSVGDFLSLVASGDIPHQDPNLLQVPLQKVMQQAGISKLGSKRKLSQQQLSALASHLAGSINNLSEAAAAASGATQSKKKKQRKRK